MKYNLNLRGKSDPFAPIRENGENELHPPQADGVSTLLKKPSKTLFMRKRRKRRGIKPSLD